MNKNNEEKSLVGLIPSEIAALKSLNETMSFKGTFLCVKHRKLKYLKEKHWVLSKKKWKKCF